MLKRLKRSISKRLLGKPFHGDYTADELSVRRRSLHFLQDERFASAWLKAKSANETTWRGRVPDIRWRAHVACWAATHALALEGDFVECGVFTGLLSLTICHFVDFNSTGRQFYLYDTFDGIPEADMASGKRGQVSAMNELYADCYDVAVRNFSPFPRAKLIRGRVPETLADAPERVAYLSIDMNNAPAELGAISFFWDRLAPGAIVVFDDYGWRGHEDQRDGLDAFAATKGVSIVSLPTGQGLLIKP